MSSAARHDYRYVNQVDPGNRPEAKAALSVAADRMIARHSGMSSHQAQVRLDGHIARLDGFRRQLSCIDPTGKCAAAVELLRDLASDLAKEAKLSSCQHDLDVSPSGMMAACRKCGFVGRWRDGMWERVKPAPAAPIPFDIQTTGEAHQAASDLRAVAAAESGADMQALPLLSFGQGAYRREIRPDPATGRLDVRA